MAKRYHWLKQPTTFFQDVKIKKLRKIAGGDTYTIIYQKMMLLSVVTDGVINFQRVEDSLEKELALILDEDEDNIKITLNFMSINGLIEEIDQDTYLVAEVPALIGSEGTSAKRVRDFRAKKALQCNNYVTEMKRVGNVEKRREEKRREEKNICYTTLLESWNSTPFPKCEILTDGRKAKIKARLRRYSMDELVTAVDIMTKSNFFTEKWTPNFNWLIANDDNVAKVLEGTYQSRDGKSKLKQEFDAFMEG